MQHGSSYFYYLYHQLLITTSVQVVRVDMLFLHVKSFGFGLEKLYCLVYLLHSWTLTPSCIAGPLSIVA